MPKRLALVTKMQRAAKKRPYAILLKYIFDTFGTSQHNTIHLLACLTNKIYTHNISGSLLIVLTSPKLQLLFCSPY